MLDITVYCAYVEQSNYLLYYTSVVSWIIKNRLNPKAVHDNDRAFKPVIRIYGAWYSS